MRRLLRWSAALTLVALALMVWSMLAPTPLPVMVAMTVGQGIGTIAFGLYGYVVLQDFRRLRGERRSALRRAAESLEIPVIRSATGPVADRRRGRDSLAPDEPKTKRPSRDSLAPDEMTAKRASRDSLAPDEMTAKRASSESLDPDEPQLKSEPEPKPEPTPEPASGAAPAAVPPDEPKEP